MKTPNKNSLIMLLCIFTLSSCFTSPEDVNKAKQDMWIIEEKTPIIETIEEKKVTNTENIKTTKKTQNKNINIEYITEEKFLKLDILDYTSFINWEAEISWTTLEKIDKIIVTFSNSTSNFPKDVFELKQFSPWNKTFIYRAHTTYKVLDFWVNEYIFTAYVWEKISKLKLTVDVKTKEEKTLETKEKEIEEIIYDKIDLKNDDIILTLPKWWAFGHPISLWENWFTYSDISGLEITKYPFSSEVNCENITDFLTEKIGTWLYWNTCRNILPTKEWEKSKWISIYVIRLDLDNYYYEKHFLNFDKWLYWSYEIEKGTWVDKENISEKNSELKEKNKDILNIEIVNNLFKEIIK